MDRRDSIKCALVAQSYGTFTSIKDQKAIKNRPMVLHHSRRPPY